MIRKEFPHAESFEESFRKLEALWKWHIKERNLGGKAGDRLWDKHIEREDRFYLLRSKPEKIKGTDMSYPRVSYSASSRMMQPTTLQEGIHRPEGKEGDGIRLTFAEDEKGNGVLIAECFLGIFEPCFKQILERLGHSLDETCQQPTTVAPAEATQKSSAQSQVARSENAPSPAGQAEQDSQKNNEPTYQTDSWYQQLTLDERQRYEFLRPHKDAWEIREITDAELAKKACKSIDTIRGWRRTLRKKGTPDMDWKKKSKGV